MKPHTKLRAGIIGIGLTLFILVRLLSGLADSIADKIVDAFVARMLAGRD